jgi:hypothetical protein
MGWTAVAAPSFSMALMPPGGGRVIAPRRANPALSIARTTTRVAIFLAAVSRRSNNYAKSRR